MNRGILLLALGSPEYGNMAANLAASIRIKDPLVAIHLVHTKGAIKFLKETHLRLFTSLAECPQEYYLRETPDKGKQTDYIRPKTFLYELTPYEETLFLDADMLLLPVRPAGEMMEELSACCDLTLKNRGCNLADTGYTYWFDVQRARALPGLGQASFYQCQSEFIFFKKTEENRHFFAKVRTLFDTPPLPCTDFRGGVADEYAYNLALAITGRKPHQSPYLPVYWYFLEGRRDWNKEVMRDYIGFSIGGEWVPDWLMQKVNAYKDYFRRALKLPYLFNVQSKKRWRK